MDRRRVAELKLSNEESQKFQKAIEHYKILNGARYLFVCYQMLVEHHEAGDQIILPPRLMTVEALIRLTMHPEKEDDIEAAIQALDRLEADPTRVRKADATKSKTLQESGKNQKRKSSRKSKDPRS